MLRSFAPWLLLGAVAVAAADQDSESIPGIGPAGLLRLPEEPSNCTFGGADSRTLYVSAQTSLYAMKMEATGHRFATGPSGPLPEGWDYVAPMKKAAAKFRGNEGVVLHVGGSMTIANPYGTWPRSGKGKTAEDRAILEWMHTDNKDRSDGWWLCRTEVKPYRAYTSESGLKSAMLSGGGKRGLPTLEKMLDEYRPRMVTIECGIYDIEDGVAIGEYRKNMARALDLILARGAIPILNTIPPFKAHLKRTRQFNDALRDLAKARGCADPRPGARDPDPPSRRLGRDSHETDPPHRGRGGRQPRCRADGGESEAERLPAPRLAHRAEDRGGEAEGAGRDRGTANWRACSWFRMATPATRRPHRRTGASAGLVVAPVHPGACLVAEPGGAAHRGLRRNKYSCCAALSLVI